VFSSFPSSFSTPSAGSARSTTALLALAATALVSTSAFAQNVPGGVSGGAATQVGGAPFLEAWVDPEIAAFNLAQTPSVLPRAGCPDQPFPTIGDAITELRSPSGSSPFPPASPLTPGLVHVMPGIYGPASVGGNGEIFPIEMRDNISIQGYSARACVIRGDQTQLSTQAFIPFVALGGRAASEALTDFSFLTNMEYIEFMEGFTFQGGSIQLYCEPEEIDVEWRVSNCVFDMLQDSDVGVPGPEFGILIVHDFDADWITVKGPKGEPIFVGGYHDARAHILNNTFIHGWQPGGDGDAVTSSRTSVAICDVANTLYADPMFPKADPDPISPILRGVGNPNIQNNLIRALDMEPRTALLGIDITDTSVILATPAPAPGGSPSNAFDPTQAVSTNGTYNSLIVQSGVGPGTPLLPGVTPVPAVIPNANQGGRDPGFVGEMLGQFLGLAPGFSRDWRVLVTTTLFDAGFGPNALGFLGAINGTTHIEGNGMVMAAQRAFDFDGEGYGNERIRFSRPDIGFDELDLVAMAGAYANDTLLDPEPAASVGLQCPNTPAMPGGGSGMSPIAISPLPASMFFAQTTTNRPYATFGVPFPTLCQSGVLSLSATSSPAGSLVPSIGNLIWVDGVVTADDFLATTAFFPSFAGYTPTSFLGNFAPLNDPAASFPIHALKVPALGTGWGPTCIVTVEQAHWIPSFGGAGFFTNMQTTFR
jgi:hypothetical protein